MLRPFRPYGEDGERLRPGLNGGSETQRCQLLLEEEGASRSINAGRRGSSSWGRRRSR